MRTTSSCVVTAFLVILAAGPASAGCCPPGQGTSTIVYVADPSGSGVLECLPVSVAIGGACFSVFSARTVSFSAEDRSAGTVGGSYTFELISGTFTPSVTFCGSAADVAIPESAKAIWIHVDTGAARAGCDSAPARAGTITADVT